MADTPDERGDPLDAIDFEEFTLEEPVSYDQPADYPAYEPPPPALITCPSCGAAQPATNRHCEQCGARLSQSALPVAPRPLGGMTAGTRALAVLGSVIGVVIVLALLLNLFSGNDEAPVAGDSGGSDTTEASTETTTTAPIDRVVPIDVRCSSELNDGSLGCQNLIDGSSDPWNDAGLQGVGATLTFTFGEPVALEQIHFFNLEDDVRFARNYRIRGIEVQADDLPGLPVIAEIPNENARQHVVSVNTLGTTQVVISVNSTWPSEPVDGKSFEELAIQEIEFWGRVAAEPEVPAEDAGDDSGGSDG